MLSAAAQASEALNLKAVDAWDKQSKSQSKKKKKKAQRKKNSEQKKRSRSEKERKKKSRDRRGEPHERAFQAQRRGEIQPYRHIKRNIEARLDGKIVGQNLVQTSKGWRYQLTVRGERGRVRRVIVNAHTGQIIAQK